MLIIETPTGVLVRSVPMASPLSAATGGTAAEGATHDAAALWGLPDFVYAAAVVRVGSGSREVGDRLLIVGDAGAVVQVKRRVGATADRARERQWVMKHSRAGLRQAHGTIRRLASGRVRMTNGRDRAIEVDGGAIHWIAVVVIDHPEPPDGATPIVEDEPNPSVVLLRRDWEFLFVQLKSTLGVIGYLRTRSRGID